MHMRHSRRWACALLALTLALAPAGCAVQQDLTPVLEAGTPANSAAPSEAAASADPSAGAASPEPASPTPDSAAEAPAAALAATPSAAASAAPPATPTATPAATPSASPLATPSTTPEAEGASLETGEAGGLDYWLYAPPGARDGLPLIVYLHGGSGRGDDLELVMEAESLPQFLRDGDLALSAYVLMPQLPSGEAGWDGVTEGLAELIDAVVEECGADAGRVSLTGHSMGGTGAFAVAAALPGRFSFVAPLSGSVRDSREMRAALADLPVWAIAGAQDDVVDPAAARDFLASLRAVNPDARYTEVEDAGHFDLPARAYLDGEVGLVRWLLSHER